ncbi:hypothetical protein Ae201684_017146 [Aphanomyces euteiches]|uniref:Uncharacterized protein n=1 Tax=Aphanomyces euteiches TaxID=100861 RepID=A0A6G0WA38_9STRA|nr:hypothetical protein Ae201684_017146 [Aphanomyces euteiches]
MWNPAERVASETPVAISALQDVAGKDDRSFTNFHLTTRILVLLVIAALGSRKLIAANRAGLKSAVGNFFGKVNTFYKSRQCAKAERYQQLFSDVAADETGGRSKHGKLRG